MNSESAAESRFKLGVGELDCVGEGWDEEEKD